MTELKIKVKKEFNYDGNREMPFFCKVTVFLPTEDGYIRKELRDKTEFLLGETLTSTWGFVTNDEEWRSRSETLEAKDWDGLLFRVRDVENTVKETLRAVKDSYETRMREKPEDEEYILIL